MEDNNLEVDFNIEQFELDAEIDTPKTELEGELDLNILTENNYNKLINLPEINNKQIKGSQDSSYYNLEDLSNKVSEITNENKESLTLYANLKAITDYVEENGGKIDGVDVNDIAQEIINKRVKIEIDKSTIGLSNVDNTSDLNKPISIETQNALDVLNTTKQNNITDLNSIRNGATAGATALQPTDVINNVTSTTTNKPLSANMGYELQEQINNLKTLGRYLSQWNATTGLPETDPIELPYLYKAGDYFRVGTVGTTNYKPSGTQYTGSASTTLETETDIKTEDIYFYDGSVWKLQKIVPRDVSFASIIGNPYDNTLLANALNSKQDVISGFTNQEMQDICDDVFYPALPAPQNLSASGTFITFSEVAGAQSYEVFADGNSIGEYIVGGNS